MKVGRPRKFKNVEELQEVIDEYFDSISGLSSKTNMVEFLKPPTIFGLARRLGVDRDTLLNYEKLPDREEFFGTIKNAKAIIAEYQEERLQEGNVVGAIFNLKNNFGMKDKTEQDIAINTQDDFIKSLGVAARHDD